MARLLNYEMQKAAREQTQEQAVRGCVCLTGASSAYYPVCAVFCPGQAKRKPVPSTMSILSQKEEVTKEPPFAMIAPNLVQVDSDPE